MGIQEGIKSLREGGFVLLHDCGNREDEFDMVAAAEFITPRHITRMRLDAGGLLCVALQRSFADELGLRYMHEILAEGAVPQQMVMGLAPYGDHPTFSISVNHIRTYTGVTDVDRARTIANLAGLYGTEDCPVRFAESFRTPGHVQLLVASGGLLAERGGHTEMAVYLMGAAGLRPVSVICEMIDAETGLALKGKGAAKYAEATGIPLIEHSQLMRHAGMA